MAGYVIKKLGYGLLVLWGVITLIFAIFSINPGDPARLLLDERAGEEELSRVRRELGLDLPRWQQYLLFLNDVSPLSFHSSRTGSRVPFHTDYQGVVVVQLGHNQLAVKAPYLRRSYLSKQPVTNILADALPGTVVLAGSAILFALVVGIALGVWCALNPGSWLDRSILVTAVLGMSVPSFFMAVLLAWLGGYVWSETIALPALPAAIFLLAVLIALVLRVSRRIPSAKAAKFVFSGASIALVLGGLDWILYHTWHVSIDPFRPINLPGTGLEMTGSLYEIDPFDGRYLALQNLLLPAFTLGIRPLSVVVQLMRNTLLEVLSQDYIRTARAKGLSTGQIVWRHALRNALNPVITAVSGWFAGMLAGAVFIEFIFNWKGLGLQVFRALETDDFPVVMGAVLLIATTFVLLNILVDLLYALLDPRIRY